MLLKGEALFWGLPILQFTPWRTAALEMLKQGQFPLWNPYLGMGAPLFANYQSALLYLPNLMLLVTPIAWGQSFLVMCHLIWAGLGIVLLCRKLGFGVLAQIVAALAFSLSGYLIARAGFISMNAAAVWLPWTVLAATHMVDGPPEEVRNKHHAIYSTVLLSIFLSMQWYAGHAQVAWYTFVFVTIWFCWYAYMLYGMSGLRRYLPRYAAGVITAFALSSAQLLPTIEYLINSFRSSGVDLDLAFTYSFWPWRFAELVIPNLFGNPAQGNFWGYGNYWEDAIYIGIVPLFFAIFGVIRPGKGFSKFRNFLILTMGVVIILALGKNTPIFPFLYKFVPTFDLFQAPTRWTLLFVFSLALLAAVGADNWKEPEGKGLYWTRLATAGAGAAIVTSYLAGNLLESIRPTFAPALITAGTWILLGGLLALLANLRGPTALWQSFVGILALINLVWLGFKLIPSIPVETLEEQSSFVQERDDGHRLYMPADLEYELTFNTFFRFDTFESKTKFPTPREVGLPNTTLMDGLISANNFDPLLPATYVRWMDEIEALPRDAQIQMLSFMNVSEVAYRSENLQVVEYMPVSEPARAWLIQNAIWVDDNTSAFKIMRDPDFHPQDTVVLEGVGGVGKSIVDSTAEIISFRESSPTTIEVEVACTNGIWLVLSDSDYPGWDAKLDGGKVPLLRANGNFRAVWVPAGTHHVVFQYLPIWFYLGSALSVLSWLILIALAVRWIL